MSYPRQGADLLNLLAAGAFGYFTVDEDVARLAAGVAAVATGDGC